MAKNDAGLLLPEKSLEPPDKDGPRQPSVRYLLEKVASLAELGAAARSFFSNVNHVMMKLIGGQAL
jgi:hypothetical protein